MSAGGGRDVVAHSCCEEGPEHVWEGEEQESAAAEGVDCPDGGPGEGEIYDSETEGG